MPQHEFLKETARKSQPLLSMLAEKKIHFPLFQKKGKNRKFSIHTVKSNYITLVSARNLTNVSPGRFLIFPLEKNKTTKQKKKKKFKDFRSSQRTPHTFSPQSYQNLIKTFQAF